MRLQEELKSLNLLSEQLKREHQRSGTQITYSLSDFEKATLSPNERKGIFHLVLPFCDFDKKRKDRELKHCDLDYIYIKIGKRFRRENQKRDEQSGLILRDEFTPYDGFLRMTYFYEHKGQLLGRCSDGYAYELPLDTKLYIAYRKLYQDLDFCIKLLRTQLNQS